MTHPAEMLETAIRYVGTPDPESGPRLLKNHEIRRLVERTANDSAFRDALVAIAEATGEVPWLLAAYRHAIKYHRVTDMQLSEHAKGLHLYNRKTSGALENGS